MYDQKDLEKVKDVGRAISKLVEEINSRDEPLRSLSFSYALFTLMTNVKLPLADIFGIIEGLKLEIYMVRRFDLRPIIITQVQSTGAN